MIVNKSESEVTALGDIEKHKVGIDEKNINHIVTILSSNLYSNPMQSFLRETVSNAIDSHTEAGTKEPIIITITDSDIAIRDFGTGISPERFEEIYTNIGSSTKRDSNEFIGHFGIGRFSALAVADVVNVTSFYNGKAYYYVMNKDFSQLHIDKLYEKDTDEHNGVEVRIPYTRSLDTGQWSGLVFIKNIYINDIRNNANFFATAFNNRKIYRHRTFSHIDVNCVDLQERYWNKVLVGDIPYCVNYLDLWSTDAAMLGWLDTFKTICPHISIGDVDITPNRENLLYSERTKKALKTAYLEAAQELTELWQAQCTEEKSNFKAFAFGLKNHYHNILKIDGCEVILSKDLPFTLKYKDFDLNDYNDFLSTIKTFLYATTDCVFGQLSNGEMQKGRRLLSSSVEKLIEKCSCPTTRTIVLPDWYGLSSSYIKGFLQSRYTERNILLIVAPRISVSIVKSFIRSTYSIETLTNSKKVHDIIKLIRETFNYIRGHSEQYDLVHSPEYLKYKEDHKNVAEKVKDNSLVSYKLWYSGRTKCNYQSYTESISGMTYRLKKEHKDCRAVYTTQDNPFLTAFQELNYPHLAIIVLSQANAALADNGAFPDNIRPIEELYSADNRILQKMAAVNYIKQSGTCCRPLDIAFPSLVRIASNRLVEPLGKYNNGS